MLNSRCTLSKRPLQKAAEATGDLIGNKITNKITKVPKNSQQRNQRQKDKGIYIPPEGRQKFIDDLRLI